MSLSNLLSDLCTIVKKVVDASGKTDNETWTPQPVPTRCRVITQVNRRKTSPDSAEKVQYGTFVFLNVVLPKTANVAAHDRLKWPVGTGPVYDVAAVIPARGALAKHHVVAVCDARA